MKKIPLSDYIYQLSPLKNPEFIVNDEDKHIQKYNKIANHIYLGNIEGAKDKEFFKNKNIKAVLNCTKDIPNYFKHKNIEYLRVPVDDSLKKKDIDLMLEFFPVAVEFIYKNAVIEKKNVFVHCYAGRQRSCINIAAYLVVKHNMTPHEACKLILSKRPEAFHFGKSLNFEDSLVKYFTSLKKT